MKAIIVLYNGSEMPEHLKVELVKAMIACNVCTDEDVQMYEMNEEEIAHTVAKQCTAIHAHKEKSENPAVIHACNYISGLLQKHFEAPTNFAIESMRELRNGNDKLRTAFSILATTKHPISQKLMRETKINDSILTVIKQLYKNNFV